MNTRSRLSTTLALSTSIAWVAACSDGVFVERPASRGRALAAECVIDVEGSGLVDIESDYLPHVVACENGAADFEALRAQAVAARSYAYYIMDAYPGQPIEDGQGDQVYTCGNPPGSLHYEAVASTAGEILTYDGAFVAAFYVSGAIPSSPQCVAGSGDTDPHGTEGFVTYNYGRRARGVEQSPLGWVNRNNPANRGCSSQNGADCLSEQGWDYEDILRFYYGADIGLEVVEGECVEPDLGPYGCGSVLSASGLVVVDDTDPCFFVGCESDVVPEERSAGVGGASLAVPAQPGSAPDCVARWRFSVEAAGTYGLEVYIPDIADRADGFYVTIHTRAGESYAFVNAAEPGWRSLGDVELAAGRHQWIEIDDAFAGGGVVVFDAIRLRSPNAPDDDAGVPVGEDAGPDEDGGGNGDVADGGAVTEDAGDGSAVDAGSVADDAGVQQSDGGTEPWLLFGFCRCTATPTTQVPGVLALLLLGFSARWGRSSRRSRRGARA